MFITHHVIDMLPVIVAILTQIALMHTINLALILLTGIVQAADSY